MERLAEADTPGMLLQEQELEQLRLVDAIGHHLQTNALKGRGILPVVADIFHELPEGKLPGSLLHLLHILKEGENRPGRGSQAAAQIPGSQGGDAPLLYHLKRNGGDFLPGEFWLWGHSSSILPWDNDGALYNAVF